MQFKENEKKRRINVRKHGIDFIGCEAIFDGHSFTMEDARFPYDETRYITLGLLEGRVVVVAHTGTEDVIEVISIRKAKHHEQKTYFQNSPFPKEPD